MTEQTNDPRDQPRTPTFVGGSFGVTSSELEGEQDPVAAFRQIEDTEDTGPDIIAAADVPQTVQEDVSEARTGAAPGTDAEPTDVEGTGTEASPGARNEPV